MKHAEHIPAEQFFEVVKHGPLVAIDFIIQKPGSSEEQSKFLFGLRKNKPAQGWYFTLGGCIIKDETLDAAYRRISEREFGVMLERQAGTPIGLWEHMWPDNFLGVEGVTTHYVVLPHIHRVSHEQADSVDVMDQHTESLWLTRDEILEDERVHPDARAYFEHLGIIPYVYPPVTNPVQ